MSRYQYQYQDWRDRDWRDRDYRPRHQPRDYEYLEFREYLDWRDREDRDYWPCHHPRDHPYQGRGQGRGRGRGGGRQEYVAPTPAEKSAFLELLIETVEHVSKIQCSAPLKGI